MSRLKAPTSSRPPPYPAIAVKWMQNHTLNLPAVFDGLRKAGQSASWQRRWRLVQRLCTRGRWGGADDRLFARATRPGGSAPQHASVVGFSTISQYCSRTFRTIEILARRLAGKDRILAKGSKRRGWQWVISVGRGLTR